jgi:hypothetical protein
MNLKYELLVGCGLLFLSTQVFSEEGVSHDYRHHILFAGSGVSAKSDDLRKSDATPWNVGYIYRNHNAFLGADIAGEGTSIENTSWENDKVSQALSYNFLAGGNLNFNQDWQAGIGVLVGLRETAKSCPSSYLGYECYADRKPDSSYDFNYGGLAYLTYDRLLVGTRVTYASYQLMMGLAF